MTTAFAYAQARLQARHAQRLDPAAWQRLGASTSLAHFLEAAQKSGLHAWVAHLHAGLSARELERSLGRELAACVEEVASWLPVSWQPATLWVAKLPLLASMATLLGEVERPAWVPLHPDTEPLAELSWDERASAIAACGLAPLANPALGTNVAERWAHQFRKLWPRMLPSARDGLEALYQSSSRYFRESTDPSRSGWQLDAELDEEVTRLFRRHPEQPAAVFCHLCLVALDLSRLRGAVVRRALFAGVESEAAWA